MRVTVNRSAAKEPSACKACALGAAQWPDALVALAHGRGEAGVEVVAEAPRRAPSPSGRRRSVPSQALSKSSSAATSPAACPEDVVAEQVAVDEAAREGRGRAPRGRSSSEARRAGTSGREARDRRSPRSGRGARSRSSSANRLLRGGLAPPGLVDAGEGLADPEGVLGGHARPGTASSRRAREERGRLARARTDTSPPSAGARGAGVGTPAAGSRSSIAVSRSRALRGPAPRRAGGRTAARPTSSAKFEFTLPAGDALDPSERRRAP